MLSPPAMPRVTRYKTLEPGKEVHGGDWVNRAAAEAEIVSSYARYTGPKHR